MYVAIFLSLTGECVSVLNKVAGEKETNTKNILLSLSLSLEKEEAAALTIGLFVDCAFNILYSLGVVIVMSLNPT